MLLRVGVAHLARAPTRVCVVEDMGACTETEIVEHHIVSEVVDAGRMLTSPPLSSAPPPAATVPIYQPLPYHFVLQDHNYGAPPPPSPPPLAPSQQAALNKANGVISLLGHDDEDTTASAASNCSLSHDGQRMNEQSSDSVTRCICEFDHDDEYMICCDECSVWQHVDCMGLDRSNIPDTYLCEQCQPRKVDRQRAKALQTRKRDSSSEESNVDAPHRSGGGGHHHSQVSTVGQLPPAASYGARARKISRRRKSDRRTLSGSDSGPASGLQTLSANAVSVSKRRGRTKEKTESKRIYTKRKNSKVKTEFNHLNEDTQDTDFRAWIDKYEEAMTNQYSPELLLRLSNLKVNGLNGESVRRASSQLRLQLCRVAQVTDGCKGLLATEDLGAGSVICEYRGSFVLGSQLGPQPSPPPPFVLRYQLPAVCIKDETSLPDGGGVSAAPAARSRDDKEEICVDAREYGNAARFVRRSCRPNAEVKHSLEDRELHLYLISAHKIHKDEEITVPFDFDYRTCDDCVSCACSREDCLVSKAAQTLEKNGLCSASSRSEKRRRRRKSHSTSLGNSLDAADESSQSSLSGAPPGGGVKTLTELQRSASTELAPRVVGPIAGGLSPTAANGHLAAQSSSDESQVAPGEGPGTKEEDGGSAVVTSPADRRKMTREERKMEAIMKAFERMEKAEQRRLETQARLQQKKKEEQEQKKKVELEKKDGGESPDPGSAADPIAAVDGAGLPVHAAAAAAAAMDVADDEVQPKQEPSPPQAAPPPNAAHGRQKGKGRKRKASGTPGRRGSRTNSGCSDVLSSPDENSQQSSLVSSSSSLSLGCAVTSCVVAVAPLPSLPPTPLSCQGIERLPDPDADRVSPPVSTVTVTSRLKTKKHLMNEWLSESGVEPSRTTEGVGGGGGDSPNSYGWRCRSPSGGALGSVPVVPATPSACGIGSVHLRRTSISESSRHHHQGPMDGSLGSAKKRWLRQAMTEDAEGAPGSPTPNSSGLSPVTPPLAGDLVAPLKKRRLALAQESDSVAPLSPVPTEFPVDTLSAAMDCSTGVGEPVSTACLDVDGAIPLVCNKVTTSGAPPAPLLSPTGPLPTPDGTADEPPVVAASCGSDDSSVSSSSGGVGRTDTPGDVAEDLRMPECSRSRDCARAMRSAGPDDGRRLSTTLESPSSTFPDGGCVTVDSSSGAGPGLECGSVAFDVADDGRPPSPGEPSADEQVVAVDMTFGTCTATAGGTGSVKVERAEGLPTVLPPLPPLPPTPPPPPPQLSPCTSGTQPEVESPGRVSRAPTCVEEEVPQTPLPPAPTVDDGPSMALPDGTPIERPTVSIGSSCVQSVVADSSGERAAAVARVNCVSSAEKSLLPSTNSVATATLDATPAPPISATIACVGTPSVAMIPPPSGDVTDALVLYSSPPPPPPLPVVALPAATPPGPSSTPTTPAKKKVSLLEYRKRKLESSSNNTASAVLSPSPKKSPNRPPSPNSTTADNGKSPAEAPSPQTSVADVGAASTPSSSSGSSTGLASSSSSGGGAPTLDTVKRRLESDVKWDCTATSAERQRENLTQRLKREFGLLTEEDAITAVAPPVVATAAASLVPPVSSTGDSAATTAVSSDLPWCPTQWGAPPPPPPPPYVVKTADVRSATASSTNSDPAEVSSFSVSPRKVVAAGSLSPAPVVVQPSAPLTPPGGPQPLMGRSIPTIVGVRAYGVLRPATSPLAPPHFAATFGAYPCPVGATATVLVAPPPPPPPPTNSGHLRPGVVMKFAEAPPPPPPLSHHPFNVHYPHLALQLPLPPPPPPPPPPAPCSSSSPAALGSAAGSQVHQLSSPSPPNSSSSPLAAGRKGPK